MGEGAQQEWELVADYKPDPWKNRPVIIVMKHVTDSALAAPLSLTLTLLPKWNGTLERVHTGQVFFLLKGSLPLPRRKVPPIRNHSRVF